MSSVLNAFGKAREVIHNLCDGRTKWTMSIPANEETDSDLVLDKALTLGARAVNMLDIALPYLDTLSKTLDHPHLRSIIAESESILEKVNGK